MKALQMHYTSCRHGLSGHAGFQTRALSDGLRPEERRELERRGGYRPPRDAPSAPSPEELGSEFPVAFRGYLLDSGRVAIVRSCYTGRDYSGRWGNFFAHSLVFEDTPENLPSVWPIDLYEWCGWTQGLPPEDDVEAASASLPSVDLSNVPSAESFELDEIAAFLSEGPDRAGLLAKMGRAVLLGHESSRRVVIRASTLDGLFWIAAIQKLFPPQVAWRMSFSTYQDDPRGCAQINATTGETDFRLDEADRKYRFYVFDLVDEVSSEVPEVEDDYPAVAAKWLSECPERHGDLIRFMDQFDPGMPDSALTGAMDLFRFSCGELVSCPDRRFAEAVEVASKWTASEGRGPLLDKLADAVCQNGLGEPSAYATLVRFLAQEASRGDDPACRRVFDVWWAFVEGSWDGGEESSQRIEELWRMVGPLFTNRPATVVELLAARLTPRLAERSPSVPVATGLLTLALLWLGRAGEGRPWNHEPCAGLLAVLGGAGAVEAALSAVQSDDEALVEVAYRLLDGRLDDLGGWDAEEGRPLQEAVGRTLGSVLSRVPPERALKVRARLAEDARWDILLGEWVEILSGKQELRRKYRVYRSDVLDRLEEYRKAREERVVETFLDALSEDELRQQAVEWMEDGALLRLGDDVAVRCIRLANDVVPLLSDEANAEGSDRLAELVGNAASGHGITLEPDRPFLYRALKRLETSKSRRDRPSLELWERLGKAVDRLSPAEARPYLQRAIPVALGRAQNLGEHRDMVSCLVPRTSPECALDGYRSFLRAADSRFPQPLKLALRYWLLFDGSAPETRHLQQLEAAVMTELVRVLADLPQRTCSRIRDEIRRDIAQDPAASRWEEIEASIEKRRRSPLRKILQVFRGKGRR